MRKKTRKLSFRENYEYGRSVGYNHKKANEYARLRVKKLK